MSAPVVVDIPHSLGKAEAKRRVASRIGDIAKYIPGGVANVRSDWPSENRMAIEVAAMGQQVTGFLDVEESVVRVTLSLPLMLSFMAGPISAMVRDKGGKLLLDSPSAGDRTPGEP